MRVLKPIDPEDDLPTDKDAYRHVKRDWVTLLAPSIIAAILSSVSSVAVCSYYIGGMNQKVVTLESNYNSMKADVMPKAQIELYMSNQERANEKNDRNLDRLNDKMDRILDKK